MHDSEPVCQRELSEAERLSPGFGLRARADKVLARVDVEIGSYQRRRRRRPVDRHHARNQ
jgi:hypothetical protein